MHMKPLALAGFAILATATSALSAVFTTYHGIFEVDNIGNIASSSIAIGDQFYFQFTIDPTAQDVENTPGYGYWPAGLTDFKMGKVSGGGSWGATDLSHSLTGAYSSSNQLIFNVETSTLEGEGIDYLHWTGNTVNATYLSALLIFSTSQTDTGTEQTLPQMFGYLANLPVSAEIAVDNTKATLTMQSFAAGEYVPAAVPEASSSLLFLGSVAIGVLRRKRK